MTGGEIICILMAYLLGGICTGYYLFRFRTKEDIREYGSGAVGARNVGRMLGRTGFAATLLGDTLKGVLAVALARQSEITAPAVSLVVVAVVAGHIWPLPLHFRGGRGISTAIGAYLAYDPMLALLLLGITGVLMVFRRGLVLSGLAAFMVLPFAAHVLEMPGHTVAAVAGTAVMILFAHRERIRTAFREALPQREA
jgi:glycerol-3-phosphate acyltransferase PlsY